MKIQYTKKYFIISLIFVVNFFLILFQVEIIEDIVVAILPQALIGPFIIITAIVGLVYSVLYLNQKYNFLKSFSTTNDPIIINSESNNYNNSKLLKGVFAEFSIAFKIILTSIAVTLIWGFISFIVISQARFQSTIETMTILSSIIGILLLASNIYAVYKLYVNSKKAAKSL
jgi:hypothetical protein